MITSTPTSTTPMPPIAPGPMARTGRQPVQSERIRTLATWLDEGLGNNDLQTLAQYFRCANQAPKPGHYETTIFGTVDGVSKPIVRLRHDDLAAANFIAGNVNNANDDRFATVRPA